MPQEQAVRWVVRAAGCSGFERSRTTSTQMRSRGKPVVPRMRDGRNLTRCLVPPPHLCSATFQLGLIADALESDDIAAARQTLHSVNLEACRRHWLDCMNESTQRHRKNAHVGRTAAKRGFVSPTVRLAMGNRDGWRCRYCALPVACEAFFKCMELILINDAGPVNDLWRIFGQSPDHVVPLAAGGDNTVQNIVSACGACNYAKSSCSIEELGARRPVQWRPGT